jgi:site-specific recombinase XerD
VDWLVYHWRETRAAAGLRDFHWHDLRHCCASFLAQNGATLLEIGHVLGHRDLATTLRYSHLVQSKPVTGHAGLDAKLWGGNERWRYGS